MVQHVPLTPRSSRRQQDREHREAEWSPSSNRRQPSSPLQPANLNENSRAQATPRSSHNSHQPRRHEHRRNDENDPFLVLSSAQSATPPATALRAFNAQLATPPATTLRASNARSEAQRRRRARERVDQASQSPAPSQVPHQATSRSQAQRSRRDRERAQSQQVPHGQHLPLMQNDVLPALTVGTNRGLPPPPVSPTLASLRVDNRRLGQQRRRERERQESHRASLEPVQRANGATHVNRSHELPSHGTPEPQDHRRQEPAGQQPVPVTSRPRIVAPARQPYQELIERHDAGRMDTVCIHCGALHWIDERIIHSTVATPKFGSCCDHGQVKLEPLPHPPFALQQLFLGLTEQGKEFRDNIRQYNAALAFTSLGVKQDHGVNAGIGPYVFRIHGELCHRAGSLLPEPGQTPSYAQLYIHDPRAALRYRCDRNGNVRADTMQILQQTILASHYYAHLYKHAFEILQEQHDALDIAIRLRCAPNQDRRRYNLPAVDEVAVILPGDGTQAMDSRDIILRLRGPDGPLQHISDGHVAYASLHYVLLFPHGEDGWHWDLHMHQPEKEKPNRITQVRHCAYRIHSRSTEFNTILRGGRLFQQYMVDMWASADQNRLNFLRNNQKKIRASLYSGLEDAVGGADRDIDLNELGRRFILPSSYTGGPRYMQQCLQDSLALARFFRKIDLFITVTCNPNWIEIQRELLPGQQPSDRPDLVARIFALKKKAILNYLYKEGAFGCAVAYVYTIEFQKRGLPHMHLLLFLEQQFKLLTPDDIDSAICAEWPDPEKEPMLFETVLKCMVHGPCGALNPTAPCMENGKCSKKFPKAFQESTTMDSDGYPKYRRRDDGRQYEVRGHMVSNQWIVPYNKHMSAKFNCHINTECAVSFGSVKYINKYMHKGGDRTTLEVNERDEIKRYLDSRYCSSPEAVWRIFQNDMHSQQPNIVRLQVHLPGQHLVTFNPEDDIETVLQRAASEKTTLTAFFRANADQGELGMEARRWTYQEFPQHFVWKANTKCWAVRRQGFAIGRMYFVPPTAGEKFYLRTLLTIIKGPQSFKDLRTYHGIVHQTFREACLARGLLEDDGEWCQCLREAADMQTGARLRHLFATILLFCNPSQPDILWNQFRHHICDDLRHRLITSMGRENPTDDMVYDFGLFLLDGILQQSGHSLNDFPPMPVSKENWHLLVENHHIAEQLNYDRDAERRSTIEREPQLNIEQADAYQRVVDSVAQEMGRIFFLHGPGGTGKTFVYNTICHRIRSEGWIVLCVASSGIAALLLCGGRTAHSMFKIPVEDLTDESHCAIPKEGLLAALLRITRLIIWDEAGMQHRFAPEAVDRTLRDIRNCPHRPFGGITVVFGGDFQQTLPVVVKGSREEVVGASIQRSYLWAEIEVLKLHQNMRLELDPGAGEFANWLLDIGHGRGMDENGQIRLRDGMPCANLQSLIDTIYPSLGSPRPPPPEYFLNRMILSARNSDVEDINTDILSRMSGDTKTYPSADTVITEAGADNELAEALPSEFLRTLAASGLPPGELQLKVGCPLILLRNLAPGRGLCNGTRMVLLRMSERVLEVRIIGGDHNGETAFIPRITTTPSGNLTEYAFAMRRRQFPVRLAFVMTINKSQGQSAKWVGLDLRVPVFSHGQLYVALSRATSGDRIKILLPEDSDSISTMNIVYPEVLLD